MNNLSKPATKLSQWDALRLESLKAYGWTNEELISRVRAGDLPADESEFHFDYTDFVAFAKENADAFEQAVRTGYQIKYNTIRGIHSWIFVALKQEAELVLETGDEAVIARLRDDEALRLASVLSYGWALTLIDETQDASGRALCKVAPFAPGE